MSTGNPYHRFSEDSSADPKPVVITSTPYERQPRELYQSHLYKLGVVEGVLASVISCLCIGSLIVQWISGHIGCTSISPGLWCTAFLLGSGIAGLQAKNNSSFRVYVANMAASILAAIMMGLLVALSVWCSLCIEGTVSTNAYLQALHNTMAIVAFAGLAVCVIHSGYCCGGLCCLHNSQTIVFTSQPQAQMASGNYMQVPEPTVNIQQ